MLLSWVTGEVGTAQAKLPAPNVPPVSLRIFPVPAPMKIPGTSPRLINARQVIPFRVHAEQQAENLEVRTTDGYKTYPTG